MINGEASFYIAPDGSMEWWETSDTGDVFRATVTECLAEDPHLIVVQVRWGDLGERLEVRGRVIEAVRT